MGVPLPACSWLKQHKDHLPEEDFGLANSLFTQQPETTCLFQWEFQWLQIKDWNHFFTWVVLAADFYHGENIFINCSLWWVPGSEVWGSLQQRHPQQRHDPSPGGQFGPSRGAQPGRDLVQQKQRSEQHRQQQRNSSVEPARDLPALSAGLCSGLVRHSRQHADTQVHFPGFSAGPSVPTGLPTQTHPAEGCTLHPGQHWSHHPALPGFLFLCVWRLAEAPRNPRGQAQLRHHHRHRRAQWGETTAPPSGPHTEARAKLGRAQGQGILPVLHQHAGDRQAGIWAHDGSDKQLRWVGPGRGSSRCCWVGDGGRCPKARLQRATV